LAKRVDFGWQVANGKDEDPVIPREDHVSLSTESTLQVSTKDVLVKFLLNELVDELYGYQFKTIAVKMVRSDFSVETREMSYSIIRQMKKV